MQPLIRDDLDFAIHCANRVKHEEAYLRELLGTSLTAEYAALLDQQERVLDERIERFRAACKALIMDAE